MKEAYLHYLWKNKRLPFQEIERDYPTISVVDVGEYNQHLKGPDFSFGKIKFGDILECGPIEFHVKSSDWYKHNHHNDPAYNPVILHVVYEHDMDVVQCGRAIPTVELKPYIDKEHFRKFSGQMDFSLKIPCREYISQVNPVIIESVKSQMVLRRFSDKVRAFKNTNIELDEYESFFKLLIMGFSMGFNKEGFQLLAENLLLNKLQKMNTGQQLNYILVESGILNEDPNSNWKCKGTRPGNHPMMRLRQLSMFIPFVDEFYNMASNNFRLKDFRTFFKKVNREQRRIPLSLQNALLINVVAVFYFWKGFRSPDFQELAFDILEELPDERISFLQKWKSKGVKMKSAYDSQSILALIHYNCSNKKCMSCQIGNSIVK